MRDKHLVITIMNDDNELASLHRIFQPYAQIFSLIYIHSVSYSHPNENSQLFISISRWLIGGTHSCFVSLIKLQFLSLKTAYPLVDTACACQLFTQFFPLLECTRCAQLSLPVHTPYKKRGWTLFFPLFLRAKAVPCYCYLGLTYNMATGWLFADTHGEKNWWKNLVCLMCTRGPTG